MSKTILLLLLTTISTTAIAEWIEVSGDDNATGYADSATTAGPINRDIWDGATRGRLSNSRVLRSAHKKTPAKSLMPEFEILALRENGGDVRN